MPPLPFSKKYDFTKCSCLQKYICRKQSPIKIFVMHHIMILIIMTFEDFKLSQPFR